MSLLKKIKGSKYTRQIRSRDQFKELYLDDLLKSENLRDYFFDENEKRKDDDKARWHYSELVRMADDIYSEHGVKNYEKKGFLRRWIAKPLRKIGSGLAAVSHYFINFHFSLPAYALTIIPATGMMLTADIVEGAAHLFNNHSKYDLKQLPKLVGEGLLEKIVANIPAIVTPGIEATLGNTKFDRAVAKKMLYKIENKFIKKFGEYKAPEEYKEPEKEEEKVVKADFTPKPKEYKKAA